MKLVKPIAVALFTLSGVLATSSFAQSTKFAGAYLQGGLGYEKFSSNTSNGSLVSTAGTPPAGTYALSTDTDYKNNVGAAIGLGYTFAISPIITLGVGVDYYAKETKYSSRTLIGSSYQAAVTGKVNNKVSFNIIPGYVISPDSLIYGKIGYIRAKVEENDGGEIFKENNHGYSLGVGYKKFLTENLYLFGEASYIKMQDKHYSGPGESYTGTYTLDSKTNAYNTFVGVGYKF